MALSFRQSFLATVDRARAIRGPGPAGLDIQTVQLTIRTRTWDGDRRGQGDPTDADLVLPQRYKVRQLTAQEVAGSAGRYEMGDWIVGPITPAYSGGGVTPEQLAPEGSKGTDIVYVLSGAVNAECALLNLNAERPFRYMVTLRKLRTTP